MAKPYRISEELLQSGTDLNLQMWSEDPACLNRGECALRLSERIKADGGNPDVTKSESRPFDCRVEISADARHIVKHLWIIFVLLPFALGLLFLLLQEMIK